MLLTPVRDLSASHQAPKSNNSTPGHADSKLMTIVGWAKPHPKIPCTRVNYERLNAMEIEPATY